jgi:hypothetical protein
MKPTLSSIAILTAALASLALAACDKAEAGATTTKAGATPAKGGTAAGKPAGDQGPWAKTGVKACDDAAAKYAACLDKNPALKAKKDEEVRAKLATLKSDAENPSTKGFVAQACTMYFELKMMDCK